jgi:hypothetical protein
MNTYTYSSRPADETRCQYSTIGESTYTSRRDSVYYMQSNYVLCWWTTHELSRLHHKLCIIIHVVINIADNPMTWLESIQASSAVWMRSAVFWDFTRRRMVFSYRRCPETSVRNYHFTLCEIPKECRSRCVLNFGHFHILADYEKCIDSFWPNTCMEKSLAGLGVDRKVILKLTWKVECKRFTV